jgi:hypothetical protein
MTNSNEKIVVLTSEELAVSNKDVETPYHFSKKRIPIESVEKVIANTPLKGWNIKRLHSDRLPTSEEFEILGKSFLFTNFFMLLNAGLNLEEEIFPSEIIEDYKNSGFPELAKTVEDEFISLQSVKKILKFVKFSFESNQFADRHVWLLQSVAEVCNLVKDSSKKRFLLESVAEISDYNQTCSQFRTPMLLHKKFLPELFVACPVWFVSGKGVEDTSSDNDPRPGEEVKFFSDLVGTKNFAWLYQIYNRRTRTIESFKGKDIMPLHISKLIPKLKEKFDYLVIATPYHDIASKEWADPEWQRNIDPYLLGFKEGSDYIVVIDRWSGTGFLPLLNEMIADTMNHLKEHLNLLSNFKQNTYWYLGNNGEGSQGCLGHDLPKFGQKIVEKFEQGTLFDFLKS